MTVTMITNRVGNYSHCQHPIKFVFINTYIGLALQIIFPFLDLSDFLEH